MMFPGGAPSGKMLHSMANSQLAVTKLAASAYSLAGSANGMRSSERLPAGLTSGTAAAGIRAGALRPLHEADFPSFASDGGHFQYKRTMPDNLTISVHASLQRGTGKRSQD